MYIATLILIESLTVPRSLPVEVYISHIGQLKACTRPRKEVQTMYGSWDTMQYPLLLASLQHCLSQRSLQLSAVLCTLTEISSATLCATLLH